MSHITRVGSTPLSAQLTTPRPPALPQVGMLAAHELHLSNYLSMPPALHLRLLSALCNDCLDGSLLRHIVTARVEEGAKHKADRAQWLA